ncbi:MAG TPA: DUF2202 domain-containing protein [Marmoricola sp.]|nr:DUF2202 domain-containing protein [Marmoricola sp.]
MSTKRRTITSLVAGAALVGGGVFASAQAMAGPDPTSVATVTAADPALTTELTFAREEERMARDLYKALADKYDGALPFSRITLSEQQHFDAVGTLLDRYGVADPADGKKAGTYADPKIQDLYDGWLADGQKSLDAAYDVGVALEKRDVADLKDTLAGDLPTDVKQVFTALLNGSQHHLAAFEAAADGQTLGTQQGLGRGYGPGMMNGQGNGPGQGRGYGMMNGWRNGGGPGNGAGFNGDCPMLDQS